MLSISNTQSGLSLGPEGREKGKKKLRNILWGAFFHYNPVKQISFIIFITDFEKLSSFDKNLTDFIND